MTPPITEAVLRVRRPEMMGERLAGLAIVERQLFALSRAGIRRVWVTAAEPGGPLRLPPGLEVRWRADEASCEPRGPRLAVSGNHLFRPEAIRAALASGAPLDDQAPEAGRVGVAAPEDKPRALAWLLAGVRKDSDGFMARLFDRHISLGITRWLLDTTVRPNHMTILSTGIGLLGAGQFFYAQRGHELLGSLLIWLHTVLDGCDGEMARLTYRESRSGALLDFWGDNVVHVALFAGLAVDLRRSEPMALVLGTLAILGALGSAFGSAWLAARNRALAGGPEPAGADRGDAAAAPFRPEAVNPILTGVARLPTAASSVGERLQKLEVLLAQRDFIYVLVVCSLFNHEEDFLWAAGLGAPLYLLIMLYLYRQSRFGKTPMAQPRARTEDRWVPASARS